MWMIYEHTTMAKLQHGMPGADTGARRPIDKDEMMTMTMTMTMTMMMTMMMIDVLVCKY